MTWWLWALVSLGIWFCLAFGVVWLWSAIDARRPIDDVPALIRQKLRKFGEAPPLGDDEASRRDGCEAQGCRGDLALYKP